MQLLDPGNFSIRILRLILPCGCAGRMTVFETGGRGSIPRRGAGFILSLLKEVIRLAEEPVLKTGGAAAFVGSTPTTSA